MPSCNYSQRYKIHHCLERILHPAAIVTTSSAKNLTLLTQRLVMVLCIRCFLIHVLCTYTQLYPFFPNRLRRMHAAKHPVSWHGCGERCCTIFTRGGLQGAYLSRMLMGRMGISGGMLCWTERMPEETIIASKRHLGKWEELLIGLGPTPPRRQVL